MPATIAVCHTFFWMRRSSVGGGGKTGLGAAVAHAELDRDLARLRERKGR
jgi:hypothetical protein